MLEARSVASQIWQQMVVFRSLIFIRLSLIASKAGLNSDFKMHMLGFCLVTEHFDELLKDVVGVKDRDSLLVHSVFHLL